MICLSCRDAVDAIAAAMADGTISEPTDHAAEVCRDHAIQPAGCPCQHKPVRRLTDAERQQVRNGTLTANVLPREAQEETR